MINYKTAQNVIDIEIKALKLLKKSIDQDSFNSAIDILFKTQGKIIISGIVKVVILLQKYPQHYPL